MVNVRKAGDIITSIFKDRFGKEFMETARSSAELFTSWEGIVCEVWPRGMDQKTEDIPAAAVHSRIRELERGILIVEADHPGWVQLLQTKQAELLKAVRRRGPGLEIRGIAFVLSRGPVPSPENKISSAGLRSCENIPAVDETPFEVKPLNERDEDFCSALKKLEESIKKRNNL